MSSYVKKIVNEAKKASLEIVKLDAKFKNLALRKMAKYLIANKNFIFNENRKDIDRAIKDNLKKSFIDRLTLNDKRLKEMSVCLKEVASLRDPIGDVIDNWSRPNGIRISKVRVPVGVILIVYEARPNVTSDCIGLLFKSSNVGILRGGRYSINSNLAIAKILNKAVKDSGIKFSPFFAVSDTSHSIVDELLKEDEYIDMVIPRGGEALIRKVVSSSRIPVIKHYKGICHVYIDNQANLARALKICVNAKAQRPSVCNAVETILVHQGIAKKFLPQLKNQFDKAKVEIRTDQKTSKILKGLKQAKDWSTEYLDLIVSVKVVKNIQEAISHINEYGSHHTDSIISKDKKNIDRFLKEVNSACCFSNISTRFSDGHQFGLGAEIGISTDKLHARGPMGLEELTTYKWVVKGSGQIRK